MSSYWETQFHRAVRLLKRLRKKVSRPCGHAGCHRTLWESRRGLCYASDCPKRLQHANGYGMVDWDGLDAEVRG